MKSQSIGAVLLRMLARCSQKQKRNFDEAFWNAGLNRPKAFPRRSRRTRHPLIGRRVLAEGRNSRSGGAIRADHGTRDPSRTEELQYALLQSRSVLERTATVKHSALMQRTINEHQEFDRFKCLDCAFSDFGAMSPLGKLANNAARCDRSSCSTFEGRNVRAHRADSRTVS
jgi:hypothetical protein